MRRDVARFSRFACLAAFALALALALPRCASAAERSLESILASGEFLTVDELHAGMKGVGKTVFRGTEIEEFGVEIIGVMRNASADGDIILGKTSGGPLAQTGIIQGMSGSPVYVDGKLIGAIAFAWSFSKEPIAGITPIAEMLDVWARADLSPDGAGADGAMGAGAFDDGDAALAALEFPALADSPAFAPSRAGGLRDNRLTQILTPVSVAGFDPRALDEVVPWLEGLGFVAAPGGGVSESGEGYSAVPGAAVGVQLISGDASVTATGTITYRDGDRLIAFGHPFFQAGDVDFPMTGAFIHGVLPSALSSFKMASPLGPLGTLTQDRRVGVAGNIGPQPSTLPVSVTVRSDGDSRNYNFRVVRDKRLTPGLLRVTVMNSIISREAFLAEKTISTRAVFHLEGGRDLVLENLFAGFGSAGSVLEELAVPAELLMQNRFARIAIESVEMTVDLEPGRRAGRLDGVVLSKNPVRPGETITAQAYIKPYQGAIRIVPIAITIPTGTPDGELTLKVCDAGSTDASDAKRAPLLNEWRDLDTFIARIGERRRNDRLYAQLEEPSVGVSIAGREFPAIPRSMFSVIDSDRHAEDAGVVSSSVLFKTDAPVEMTITGCTTLTINVDSKLR